MKRRTVFLRQLSFFYIHIVLICTEIGRSIRRFTAPSARSKRRRGRYIGGVCKTESSVRPSARGNRFRPSGRRRIFGCGRVWRPATTRGRCPPGRLIARGAARQLCNHWSNHGALNSQITPRRNETKRRHACITDMRREPCNNDNIRRIVFFIHVYWNIGQYSDTQIY